LATGLVLLGLARYLKFFSFSTLHKPLVMVYAACISLLMVEMVLQVMIREDTEPALWPQGREVLLAPDPGVMPGVYGVSTFTGNEVGLRGPSLPSDANVFKIVAVGGSTTQELYLDDSETWPQLIMDRINKRQPESPVWVGNAGQSGRNTLEHLVLMETLPILNEADLLIFLIGINDFGPALAFAGAATQGPLGQRAEEFRLQVLRGGGWPRPPRPYFKHSMLFSLLRNSKIAQIASVVPSSALGSLGVGPGIYYEAQRRQRAQAPVVAMPNLATGLDEYRQRIRNLDGWCRANETRCLFLTQPSIFRDDLTPDEERLVWIGWVGLGKEVTGYVSVGDLALGLDAYNQVLLEMCKEVGLDCYDLASHVPKDTSAFYDGAHFNEEGARVVGRLLADYILSSHFLEEKAGASR
jgi:lysophospholipase L1-like esterase